MNIAIVPWSDKCLENRMFRPSSQGEEVYTRVFAAEKEYFEKRGHRYETIDQYHDGGEIDWIIVYYGSLYRRYMQIFIKEGFLNKLVYYAFEPEAVVSLHKSDKVKGFLRYVKYIITWNKDAVDEKRIFYINWPYTMKKDFGDVPFEKRKLLTAIYSNKFGCGKKELYSERRKIFRYFEGVEDTFDLYGYGWSVNDFHNYKGEIKNKAEIYQGYRFAIALENVKNIRGGVSEKIFDCLCAGIVPVYLGARDITHYVPEEAFIDYGKFKNIDEMYHFLKDMDENTWEKYREAAEKYLCSKQTDLVSVDTWCKALEKLLCDNPARDIKYNALKKKWYIFCFWISNTFLVRGCRYISNRVMSCAFKFMD